MNSTQQWLQRGTIAALMLLSATTAQGQKLQAFSYPTDGFKASFPAEPELEKKSQPGKTGIINLDSYCSQSGEDHYCVVVFSNGVEATGLAAEMIVEVIKQGVLTSPRTHKVSESAITVDGHAGVEIIAENDATHTTSRIFAVGETIYQLLLTTPLPASKSDKTTDPARFFSSFKLINRKGN